MSRASAPKIGSVAIWSRSMKRGVPVLFAFTHEYSVSLSHSPAL